MTYELVAVCDRCLGEIPDGEGVLEVNVTSAARVLERWAATFQADAASPWPPTRRGRAAAWRVRHHGCGRDYAAGYRIPVERIRTWTGVLDWAVHLSGKPWFLATDWNDLVDRALRPQRAAVSGLLPAVPRDLRGGPVGDRPGDRAHPA
ncbi:hypothetical protein AB0J38_25205 [Streptomyces sp. NPDC050095]|uniref:hypothetical protein n=1 Tax=unclassified Streptomyces TaxID=2593676 RepID=UPI0034152A8A